VAAGREQSLFDQLQLSCAAVKVLDRLDRLRRENQLVQSFAEDLSIRIRVNHAR